MSTDSGDFLAGLEAARASLDSGAAADVLARYAEMTQEFGES
jgi:hypothetical protein